MREPINRYVMWVTVIAVSLVAAAITRNLLIPFALIVASYFLIEDYD